MSRLREIGSGIAYYFGFGARPPHRGVGGDEDQEPWLRVIGGFLVRLLPVLAAAFFVRSALGFEDDFLGLIVLLGLVVVFAPLWALIVSAALRRIGKRAP
jgi:peptidoglycan/LPS O-acetylase OafA/YrhL